MPALYNTYICDLFRNQTFRTNPLSRMYTYCWIGVLFSTVVCLLLPFTLASPLNFKSELPQTPGHVHIAYGDAVSKMIITWSTVNGSAQSVVKYGIDSLNLTQSGDISKFTDGGHEKRVQYIHRVELTNLTANSYYFYVVGGSTGWSDIFGFKTMPEGEDWGPSLVVIGDMGYANAQSLPRIEADAVTGMYDALIHVGDFAYDLDKDNAKVGDAYMQLIQPIAANMPYMTCVGNHENSYNFSNYRNRFNMPHDNKKMYYSFNMGPVHFISFSTEFLYFPYYGYQQIFDQNDWLAKDLEEANHPDNRTRRPWIVTFGHRPMYCSNNDNDDCASDESLVRVGVPLLHIKGLEDLFHNAGVDVALWGHEHSYERLWPVYNRQVRNGSYQFPYTNPQAMTHIITGSAGCSERHEYFRKHPADWSAFHSSDYGYTRMKFFNKTHMAMEQVSDDQGGKVIDRFTLIKDSHGSYK